MCPLFDWILLNNVLKFKFCSSAHFGLKACKDLRANTSQGMKMNYESLCYHKENSFTFDNIYKLSPPLMTTYIV